MTTRYFTAAIMATLLLAATANAQSGADLLQKGIYAQETLGDLDGAIQIYRQVTGSATAPKQIAAQAQYQLVLSMLQKGDRAAASHELDLLTRNFPDQQDYIDKARKLIPGASTLLAAPWAEGEASQLNIKRDGAFTGEYLYYSATPWRKTVPDSERDPTRSRDAVANAQAVYLGWKLVTKTSTRSVMTKVDRDTLRHMEQPGENPRMHSDDLLGDLSAAPFAGPAIDAEPLVFRMRVLPLAAGYKTTLTTLPFLLGYGVPRTVELAVAAVETVKTVAGSFKCYKVSLAPLEQTFWIGVDGARPLVKFQSGNVEAELVKMWGPSAFEDGVAFLKMAGWSVDNVTTDLNSDGLNGFAFTSLSKVAPFAQFTQYGTSIWMRRIYTPPSELDQAVQHACSDRAAEIGGKGVTDLKIRPQGIQTRIVGGYRSVSCVIDSPAKTDYSIWIFTEGLILRFSPSYLPEVGVYLWAFDPVIATFKLP
jgi:hypothetical protein